MFLLFLTKMFKIKILDILFLIHFKKRLIKIEKEKKFSGKVFLLFLLF